MILLLDTAIPRTLRQLVERFTAQPATRIEAWLFEDVAERRAAEEALAKAGVAAVLRSAYKPLVHFFLEEFEKALKEAPGEIAVHTPAGKAQRFRLEAYPLAGLIGDRASLRFIEGRALEADYLVEAAGRRWQVFAPNDAAGSPCGWLRVWHGDTLAEDAPLRTEFEIACDTALETIRRHEWPATLPLFDTLEIEVATSGIERRLPFGEETISTFEALQEDLYYGALEFFKARAGLPDADRTLQLGQIVPRISASSGETQLSVRLARHRRVDPPVDGTLALDTAVRSLAPVEVEHAVAALPGEPFSVTSFQGRKVAGVHVRGALPGLVVTAGQHANESSGVVGALRAARHLNDHRDAHYALVPLENPDGAALHHYLQATHPTHMAHSARYTALGDDLEARMQPPFGEKAARLEAIARTGARLHLSLHGYPAHEWTRPRAGYVPRGSELWTVPKGFFLILRRHPGYDGMRFLVALTEELQSGSTELAEFNARQQKMWHAHVGDLPYECINGIPCLVMTDERSTVPFTLVTEFPDETVRGAAFQLAHTTQMRTVLAAARLYWKGLLA
ncbi:hypothetical protein [Variovorax sp. OV700]|uniref:hypothetical protein n=1 Tax=Variovorax sp. OV700 TaxID=1882826 RepID=UPI00088A7346|nr:hypothetical protein [Variovorax sp. OV700]SDI18426.1 hypothetical protein SAMN05444748_10456 [Variovorax sp. OV700]